jgi:dynactin 4
MARDIPGIGKYTPALRGRRDEGARDEISEYRSRVEVGGTNDGANVDFMRRLEEASQVAALGQQWANSWTMDAMRQVCILFDGVDVRIHHSCTAY